MNIEEPLRTFYNRLFKYRIGDTDLYKNLKSISENKYCFNPYIATECDVQVKLGGILEEYFMRNGLEYSVNAEMKIYSGFKNNRVDLSIHKVAADTWYTEIDSPKRNLEVALEVKYANAANPDYEFKRGLIILDLQKLESLPKEVKRVFVFIDEANRLSPENVEWLIKKCAEREIQIFTNNNSINKQQNYSYGK